MKSELVIKESLLVWRQDGEKASAERCGGLEEGKTERVSHLAFPFCVFAAPPPALPVLATQARKKQEIMVLYMVI